MVRLRAIMVKRGGFMWWVGQYWCIGGRWVTFTPSYGELDKLEKAIGETCPTWGSMLPVEW